MGKKIKALREAKEKSGKKHDLYAQHYGFGSKLMRRAEEIAMMRGYERIAVIAGIGTREYYKKFGYELEGTYMVKVLRRNRFWNWMKAKKVLIASSVVLCVGAVCYLYQRESKQRK